MAEKSFGALTPGGERSPADINGEIERTRMEMRETLGEIQERLRPHHVMQQARDTVTGAAAAKARHMMESASEAATRVADQTREAGRSVADYAYLHPVQMALLAGGATWWLLRGRGRHWEADGYDGLPASGDFDAGYAADEGESLRDQAGEYVSAARDSVSEYASSAGRRARETWRRTSSTVDSFVHDSPMVAGAMAMAVGLAIGLSVPGTEWEDRTLGERRDQALQRARAKARELASSAGATGETTAPRAASAPPATTVGSAG